MKKITLFLFAIIMASSFATAATGWFNDFLTIKVNGVETTNNYYIGDNPSSGTALQGTVFGTVSTLEITGCNMSYWSDTQDRIGGAFYYKVTNADNTADILTATEVIWDQTGPTGNDYKGTKTTTINLTNLVLANGSYQLHVWAKSWGTGQGDNYLSNNSANYVATFTISRPVSVTGAAGITDNTSYATLKAAFDAINAQADQSTKDIEIKINGSTTELATAALNQPTTASWNSLTIYPTASNVTIGGVFTNTLIDLNGADNVIITGKLNKTGAAKNLTISQTENTNNSSRTIRIWNDASNNNINNCIVRGSCISSGAGVIFFGDAKTAGTGNDNNIIEYCDINAAGAANGINAASAVAVSSEGNIIRGNNIYDFYLSNTSTTVTNGITVTSNYTTSTITGNSLYQTQARDYNTTTAVIHLGINVGGASNGNTISGNFIGGSAPLCAGTAWTVTGGLYRLFALQTSLGTTTTSSIQGNTIANLDITTGFVTNASSAFIGIQHGGGSVNIGTETANTIGSTTTTGSIKVTFSGVTTGSLVVGINTVTAAAATQVFSNNKIGGILIEIQGNDALRRAHFYGISSSGAGALTITNNTIGSTTVANSIELKGCVYSNATLSNTVNLRGINTGNVLVLTCTGNTIANLIATSTSAHMTVNGIFHNGGAANNVITGNIIRDIKSASTRVIATQGVDASLIGIVLNSNSAGNTVGGNTIYNLENTNTTLATDVYGINFHSLNAGTSSIENNKIYNLTTASTNQAANVVGISITRGLTTTKNNMITLGDGITNAVAVVGIRKLGTAATQNNNFYHNTVLISGSEVGITGTTSTSAFVRAYAATDEVKNNIFINTRSNGLGNTQKHYAINLNATTTLTSDNNLLSVNGTGGLLGLNATTDCTDLAAWRTSTSLDAASKSANVNFSNSTAGDLTIAGLSMQDANLKVPSLTTVTTDILGTIRNTSFTYAGAHESTLPFLATGIEKAVMNSGIKVSKTGIEVVLNNESAIELYNANGVLIEKTKTNGMYSRSLNNGVYIININGKATKFVK